LLINYVNFDSVRGLLENGRVPFIEDRAASASLRRGLLALLVVVFVPGAALATTTVNHQFTPATINPGDVSVYKITIANSSLVPLTAAAVTEVFPPQITIASPAGITNTCGFTVNAAAPGTSTVFLTAGTIPAGTGTADGQCFFQLNVTATAQGNWLATIPANTTPNGTTSGYTALESGVSVFNTTPASATLAVNTMSPPTGTKAYSATRLAGTPFTVTVTLTNPNAAATIPLTSFVDTFPAGMQVASPPGAGVVCTGTGASNGTVTAVAGAGSVTLTGGVIGQGGTCTLTFSVVVPTIAASPQNFNNALASGAIGNTRSLTSPAFNQIASVTTPITVSKTFGTPLIPAGQPSLTTIVIGNASAANPLAITSFADNLTGTTLRILSTTSSPVAAPANPAVACSGVGAVNGTLSAPADLLDQTISLTGATAGRSGNCTITAYLTSTVDGAHVNTIAANAVANPGSFPSPAVSATLTANAQLTVSKTVTIPPGPASANVAPGQWAKFVIAINNYSGGAVAGVTFKDVLPSNGANQMTLFDAGSGLFTAPGPGCTGGTFTGTDATGTSTGLPPTALDAGLLWTGGTIVAGVGAAPGVCTISIWAQVPAAAATGLTFTNGIPVGSVTGTGPAGGIANTNASSANVVTISAAAVSKAFAPGSIAQGGLSTLTLTIRNRTVSALTGVNLTDNLPAGVTLASNPAATNSCSPPGSLQAFPNGTQIALTGGTVASRPVGNQESTCAITVRVTGASTGVFANTINPADFSNAQGAPLPAAVSANLTITTGLTAVKTFTPTSVAPGGVSRVKLTLTNSASGSLTNVSVNDSTFSAGLAVSNPANAATNCAGGPTMVVNPGATNAQLLGATLAAAGSCDFSFDVVATGAGPWSNTVPAGNITSAEGVSNTAAVTANLTKTAAQININKSFNPVLVTGGTPSILQIDVTNPSAVAISGVGLTDSFPPGIVVYSVPAASTDCTGGIVAAVAGDSKVVLSGASVAIGQTCHVFVTTTSTKFLNLTNTIPANSVVSAQGYTNPLGTSATLSTLQGLGVAKAFSPAYVAVGQVSTLTMSLISTFDPNAPTPLTLTGVSYTDTLPNFGGVTAGAGLLIAPTPNAGTTCPGTGPGGLAVVSTSNGASNGSVTVSQATIAPGTTCTVSVDTVASALGAYNNTIPINAVTTDQGIPNASAANATLFVVTNPTVGKSFANATRNPGQSTVLTVTITNGNTIPLTGVSLTDTLPAGLEIASTPATGGTCTASGGLVTANAGGATLSMSGATIAANSSCTFFASVLGNTPGTYIDNIPVGSVITNEGLSNPGAATATLAINAPPTVAKAFSPASIASGATSTLTITLGNANAASTTLSAAFTDALPGNVFVAAVPNVVKTCTGGVTAVAGSTSITYANGSTIPAGGCTISVNVTPSAAGSYTNVVAAGQLSTAVGVNQQPATASLGVDAPAPPTIAKGFAPGTIPASGTSTLTIAFGNPNAGALTLGAPFTDTLPSNVVVASPPNVGGSCTGTVTATAGAGAVTWATGSTIPAGGCTITVAVTSAVPGSYTNTILTAALTTDGGSPPQPATAGLVVQPATPPTVAKSFNPGTINPGAASVLTINLGNPNSAAISLTSPFTDTLPANVAVASTPGASTNCTGGTLTATALATFVTLSGGSIQPGGCSIVVNVSSSVPGGPYTNTILAGSLQTSAGNNGATVTAKLFVNPAQPPSVSKSFTPSFIGPGGISKLSVSLANPNASAATLTSDFVDTLPGPGLVIATPPNLLVGAGCTPANVVATAGGTTVTYQNGGGLAGSGGCSLQVDVTSSTVTTYTNTIPASALKTSVGNNAVAATATLQVLALPTIAKSFTPASIPLGANSTLTLTFGNANAVALTLSADFVDTLPSNLVLGTPATVGGTCAAASVIAAAGGSTVTFESGATIPAAPGCTVTVPVTTALVGGYDNATGPVTTTIGSSPTGASAHLDVYQADLSILKTDGVTSVVPGTTTTYTIVVSNAGPSPVTNASVTDVLPAGVASATWTCAASAGSSCGAASGSGSLATSVSLLPAGIATYTVVASVSPSATGTLVNTAAVTPPANVADPDLSNNVSTDTDTLVPTADLSITKTDGSATAVPGATTTYTIVVSNAGPSAVTNAPVADLLPGSVASATWTCVATGGSSCGTASGTGNLAANVSLAPSGTATFTLVATLAQSATGTLTNTATVGVPPGVTDPNPANNTATDTDTLTPRADLAVTKTDGTTTAVPGGTTTYTVVFSNVGPSAVSAAPVADTLPAAVASATWTCVASAGSSCGTASGAGSIGDAVSLLAGGTATYTIVASLSASATGTLVNTATIAAPAGVTDPNPANNSATDTDTLVPTADLSVTKTDGVTTAIPGTTTTYTIAVSNAGPSAVTGAPVTDPLPAAVTSATWTCAATAGSSCGAASGTGSLATSASLLAGGSATYTVVASLSQSATGTLVNTAAVAAPGGVTDPNLANNSATDTDTLVPTADLSVTKTNGVTSAVPGTTTTYTIVVSNAGPSAAVGAPVSDALPAAVVSATWTCVASGGSSCGTAAGSGNVAANVSLLAGGTATFTLAATLSPSATGTLANTAAVGVPPGVTDPNPGNNVSTDVDTLTPQADLALVKTGPGTLVPGQNAVYTVTATNLGPSSAVTASWNDTLPPGTTFVSLASPGGWSCTTPAVGAGGPVTCSIPSFDPPAPAVFTLTVKLDPGVPSGTAIANVAIVSSPTPDPNPANNASTTSGTAAASADLSISKTGPATAVPGGANVVFTTVVTNNGPSDAQAVQVTDPTPANLTFVSNAVDCMAAFPCSLGTVPAGATRSITSTYAVPSGYPVPAPIANTATVSSSTPDPVPANNSSTATVLVPSGVADVAVTKTVSNPAPAVGTNVTYTVTVSDLGPSDASGVALTDVLPTGLAFVSAAPSQGTYTAATGVWAVGSVANGASATLSVVATVTQAGTIVNTATKTAGDQTDPNPSNNSGTAVVNGPAAVADIQVQKAVDNAVPTAGSNVTFTVTARNAGPSNATNVAVTDVLPPGLTFVSATPSQGSYASGTGIWTIGNLPNGASVTLALTATVTANGTYVNTAAKTAETEFDPNTSNDRAVAGVVAGGGGLAFADLGIVKTDSPDPVRAGQNLTYTLVVTNRGPNDATNVTVNDPLPAAVSLATATPSQGGCSGTTTVTCLLGGLPAGNSATITLVVSVSAAAVPSITNTANVTATETDPNPGDNSSTAATTVLPVADVAITKTVSNPAPLVTQSFTFTVTAANNGPSTATGVVVTDVLPANLGLVSATPSQGSWVAGTGVWTVGTLANGASATLGFTVTALSPGAFTNTATKTGQAELDPNPANDTASAPGGVGVVADLTIAKTHAPASFVRGSTGTFTLTVTNAGTGPTNAAVSVTDFLPAGLTPMAAAGPGWTCTVTAPNVSCGRADALAAGAAWPPISVTVSVLQSAASSLTNTAAVAGGGDITPGNDTATDVVPVVSSADVSIVKTGPANAIPGTNVAYTLVVTNNGPSDAQAVFVADPTPVNLSFVSNSGACATPFPCSLGTVPAGGTRTITATFAIPANYTAPSPIVNTAVVSSSTPDPNPANDSSSAPTSVAADLAVVKTIPGVAAGGLATYTIVVTNNGPSLATNVVLTDPLPAPLSFFGLTTTQGSCTPGPTVTCALGTLAAGATATVTVTVLVSEPPLPPVRNTASVTADQYDPDLTNNSSSADIAAVPAIPALSEWGLMLLGVALALAGARVLRRG
jgi:uncharacterized repeat protein (TIGR01451 family)